MQYFQCGLGGVVLLVAMRSGDMIVAYLQNKNNGMLYGGVELK